MRLTSTDMRSFSPVEPALEGRERKLFLAERPRRRPRSAWRAETRIVHCARAPWPHCCPSCRKPLPANAPKGVVPGVPHESGFRERSRPGTGAAEPNPGLRPAATSERTPAASHLHRFRAPPRASWRLRGLSSSGCSKRRNRLILRILRHEWRPLSRSLSQTIPRERQKVVPRVVCVSRAARV